MMARGSARVARLITYRHNERTTGLIGKIEKGPKSEIGREVYLSLTKADLPVLHALVAELEASA